ncbi:hypothetical protein Hanom_Chr07g00659891 [Helianthus anomalus]
MCRAENRHNSSNTQQPSTRTQISSNRRSWNIKETSIDQIRTLLFLNGLRKPFDTSSFSVEINVIEAWACRKARHSAHGPDQRVYESSTNASPNVPDWQHESRWSPLG